MKRTRPPISGRQIPGFFRWLIWLTFILGWTGALLVPVPKLFDPGNNQQLKDFEFFFSKSLHVTSYALMAVFSGWLKIPRPWRWLLLIFMSLHGMATEFGQQFVAGRHSSWRDVGLDHIGIVLGMIVTWKWWRG